MLISRFEDFSRLNEDVVSNLTQQKNSLTQQMNDIQKKLLDVEAQLVAAQKQTLAQNPQAQIPMQENEGFESEGFERLPAGIEIISAFYIFKGNGKGVLNISYITHDGSEEEIEAEVSDFEDYIENEAIQDFDKADLKRFVRGDEDSNYLDTKDFWDALDRKTRRMIIIEYLQKKNLIS